VRGSEEDVIGDHQLAGIAERNGPERVVLDVEKEVAGRSHREWDVAKSDLTRESGCGQ
jgi:hypothetical protein